MKVFASLITGIAYLEFIVLIGFLVFGCLRTRSKGLILITATLFGTALLDLSIHKIFDVFIGRWEPGMVVDIALIASGVKVVFLYGLYLFGAFLIYKEWRQGKLNYPPTQIRPE